MNPYQCLDEKSFWKLSVAAKNKFDISDLWQPKFKISRRDKVSTYGSCFAQHIGNALRSRDFNWFISEQAPCILSKENSKKFNYGVFSARTGNIYTTSLLKQWVKWSLGVEDVPLEIWEKDSRFFDPFRPNIEPNGFESKEELLLSRDMCLGAFKRSITEAKVFVFTLGLTESWFNKAGYEYSLCPGTVAGEFDESVHFFKNQNYKDVLDSLTESIKIMRGINKNLKFILTVSPVPLVATNSGKHVLLATMHSKSVLRAVAAHLSEVRSYVDYFPSYEIINSPVFEGTFFEPNKRGVNGYGVNFVMDEFFNCLMKKYPQLFEKNFHKRTTNLEDLICEEELLEAFGAS